MSRYVEQAYDDKPTVIFTQGASGDQNPLYLRPSTNGMASREGVAIPGSVLVRESVEAPLRDGTVQITQMDPQVRERLERWIESEGDLLGEEVIRVITDATRSEHNVRIWGSQTEVTCPGRTRTDKGREGTAGTYADGPPVPIRIGVLQVLGSRLEVGCAEDSIADGLTRLITDYARQERQPNSVDHSAN